MANTKARISNAVTNSGGKAQAKRSAVSMGYTKSALDFPRFSKGTVKKVTGKGKK